MIWCSTLQFLQVTSFLQASVKRPGRKHRLHNLSSSQRDLRELTVSNIVQLKGRCS